MKNTEVTLVPLTARDREQFILDNQCTHPWNSGELTKAATAAKAGTITYTCTLCGEKKTEKVEAGTTVITRADIEDALVATAWAYFVKGTNMQYDSAYLSAIGGHYGGTSRHTNEVAPEYGTSDTTIFSVCTGFTHKVYLQTINRALCERQYTPNPGYTQQAQWLPLG